MKQITTYWLMFTGETWQAKKTLIITLLAMLFQFLSISQTVTTFNYTGSVQSFTAPYSATYKLECWGAQGGTGESFGISNGGYVSGTLTLAAGTTLSIYVGGKGNYFTYGSNTHSYAVNTNGGWNGGGGVTNSAASHGTGGGATDICLTESAVSLSNYAYTRTSASYLSRIIVAGGGGGNGFYNPTVHAGGGVNGIGEIPGTQTLGGIGGTSSGQFGYGGNGAGCSGGGSGGGGGWYGGGGGKGDEGKGGGGSSFVLTSSSSIPSGYTPGSSYYMNSASNIAGNASMPNPSGGTMTGRSGNGIAVITFLYTASISQTANILCNGSSTGALLATVNGGSDVAATTTFNYTGAMQTFTVPVGITSITLEAWGAQGGIATTGNGNVGGLGGYSKGNLVVTPGQILNIYVGGKGTGVGNKVLGGGGFNGGGNAQGCGDGGGGASDIRVDGTALSKRVIVAGGGGGNGYYSYNGGAGGGTAGAVGGNTTDGTAAYGGGGGTQTAGGTGSGNFPGLSGSLGIGGNGNVGAELIGYSGGGGGGYYGGAGGASSIVYGNGQGAAGGGGSSYIGGVTAGTTTAGLRLGDGLVTISYAASYSYAWAPSGGTAETATGLAAGTYTVTITNGVGATTTASYTIIEPTVLTATGSQVNNECPSGAAGSATVVPSEGTPNYTFTWTPDGGTAATATNLESGTYTCTIKDANLCSITKSFTIIQEDVVNPIITGLSDLTTTLAAGACTKSVETSNPTTADNCSVAKLTWSMTGSTIATSDATGINNVGTYAFNLGVTTVTYTVYDATGNSASESSTVTIADSINPTITAPATVNVTTNTDCAATGVAIGTPITADNCTVAMVNSNHSSTTYSLGATLVTWVVTDGSGNTATATQTVNVTDNVFPTITAPVTVNVTTDTACTATDVALGTPLAADNCTVATLTNDHASTTYPLGSTLVTWTVMDSSGNTATATQTVNVTDAAAPVANVTSLLDATGQCSATVVAPTATDNCSGIITGTTADPLTYSAQGSYIVHWIYSDGNGNSSAQNQNVVVADNTAPTYTVLSNTVSCDGHVSSIAPINVSDNCSSSIAIAYALCGATTATGYNDASLELFNVGTTTVTYMLSDGNGNSSQFSFNVNYQLIDATVTVNQNLLTANGTGTYQWFDCTNNVSLSNESLGSYTTLTGGSYAVVISNNGCVDTSDCNVIAMTDIASQIDDRVLSVSIYPNPTDGIIYVNSNSENSNLNVSIYNISGKIVYDYSGLTGKTNVIDIEKLCQGVYYIKISNSQDQRIIKLVKQ